MHNYTKEVGLQPFQVADFAGYNFIFRYPWLAEADLKIYFKTGTFKQQNNQELEDCISLISLKDILNNIALGKTVYTLYLKEYWVQPLSHSKIGVELYIGENTSITDTL